MARFELGGVGTVNDAMIRLLSILLLTTAVSLQAEKRYPISTPTWFACNTAGKIIDGTSVQGAGVTQTIPDPSARCLSFLVTEQPTLTGDLRAKTITATIVLTDATAIGCFPGGCNVPPNVRLYISTQTGPYNLNYGLKHPSADWWSSTGTYYWMSGPNTTTVTLTSTFDPSTWSDALGTAGSQTPADFDAAVANVRQIGLAFGAGCYYDTGIRGSGIIAITSFTIQ